MKRVDFDTPWVTKDKRKLFVFEMDDAHLANLSAYLVRRLKSGEYKIKHVCGGYSANDGPCWDCDLSVETAAYLEGWIRLISVEQRRRTADAARAC